MANRLKELRMEKELSILKMAKATGLAFQTLWNIEQARVSDDKILLSTAKKIAMVLEKKIEEIFF